MTVKVGDTIRNNDPRTLEINREQEVRAINSGRVWYWSVDLNGKKNGRVNKIDLSRIFTDGRARAQGWNLVTAGRGYDEEDAPGNDEAA